LKGVQKKFTAEICGLIGAILNNEILQEIPYRHQSIKKLALAIQLARETVRLSERILPVTGRSYFSFENPGISPLN
jgi:hypothetical protein